MTRSRDGHRRELACLVALLAIGGLGPATVLECLRSGGGAAAWDHLVAGRGHRVDALAAAAERLRKREPAVWDRMARDARAIDPARFLALHEAGGQEVVSFGEQAYPDRLVGDPSPPPVLFLQGTPEILQRPTVAIVGTRNATRLGRETAGSLASELADRGISVVSGLALGIDGAAHLAIVDRGSEGRPVGVIATGLERAYPRHHRTLHRQVAEVGLLVSESPIGSEPSKWRFPARNRIIAGLADAVVVVESRSTGGSMLTAVEGLARDRPVLAVPGHPTSASAAGTLDLIADGAVPLRDVEDVLVAIGHGGLKPALPPTTAARSTDPTAPLSEQAIRLLEELDPDPRTLGELVLSGSLGLDAASAALIELEQAGLVQRAGAWFERTGAGAGGLGSGRRR